MSQLGPADTVKSSGFSFKYILASYCFIMHERLLHGTDMSKPTRNVSNTLYEKAKKHSANLWLHMVLNDAEFERVAKE